MVVGVERLDYLGELEARVDLLGPGRVDEQCKDRSGGGLKREGGGGARGGEPYSCFFFVFFPRQASQ